MKVKESKPGDPSDKCSCGEPICPCGEPIDLGEAEHDEFLCKCGRCYELINGTLFFSGEREVGQS